MPGPPAFGGAPITNIRNTKSPHWRRWLKPENRCVVPWTSFCEYADTKPKKTPTWFALSKNRPLAVFAGVWTSWKGTRGTKANPVEGEHQLFGFLTTEANDVAAGHRPRASRGWPAAPNIRKCCACTPTTTKLSATARRPNKPKNSTAPSARPVILILKTATERSAMALSRRTTSNQFQCWRRGLSRARMRCERSCSGRVRATRALTVTNSARSSQAPDVARRRPPSGR